MSHVFNWTIWPDFFELPEKARPVVRFEAMEPGEPLIVEGRRFEMVPVKHVVPAVAYRVQGPEGAFAFSGDTTTNDSLWERLNASDRLDLLMVECAFAEHDLALSRLAGHYCPSLLAADMAKLQHRPVVGITHLKPGEEAEIYGECEKLLADFDLRRLKGGDSFEL